MIKPTMSHAVNKEHLNELLVDYYEKRTDELEAALIALSRAYSDWAMNVSNEDESLISRLLDQAETK